MRNHERKHNFNGEQTFRRESAILFFCGKLIASYLFMLCTGCCIMKIVYSAGEKFCSIIYSVLFKRKGI